MKFNLLIIAIISIITIGKASSQSLFPDKFQGCNTDRFALESDSTTAKIDSDELIKIITSTLSDKQRNKISGKLTLQIIVDLNGNSCLLSVKNDTNIKTTKIDLKSFIDNKLVWDRPTKKVAAIVLIGFTGDGIKIKRLGMNAKKGVHELTN
jgi:hypothetical protein